jgi:uncharacterized membrane protein (DUF485 family)
MLPDKKGQSINTGVLVALVSAVMILVIVTITLAFGAEINNDLQDDFYSETAGCNETSGVFTGCTSAWNVSHEGLEGLNTLAEKQTTWALIIGVGVVIALLLGFLGFVAFKRM